MTPDNIASAPQNCGKCGLCLSVCPVYQILKEEQASPRARLQLIKAFETNTLESSFLLKEIISNCLMCGACARICPSGINHYEKFMDMREKMAAALGDTPAIKGLIFLLAREYRLRAGAKMAGVGQQLTPEFLEKKYRLGQIPISCLPQLNPAPFRQTLPEKIRPKSGKPLRGKLVYFSGCATNYMFEDTGRASVKILKDLGYEVIIPRDQTCCAIPLLYHGAGSKARKNIITNIRALACHDYDHIIVDCTTCGAALKDEYPLYIQRLNKEGIDKGDTLSAQAQTISEKTMDILIFLSKFNLKYDPPPPKISRGVYHAPCHSRNSFNSHPRVQDLLRHLPNLEYVPTAEEDLCCGGGGTFFYEHPKTAQKIMEQKQAQITHTNADLWLTDCPVCRLNLQGNLPLDSQTKIIHPVTLICQAMARETP
ncbi:MAG: (Fe-S)-binding protein [Desulfobacter sp.]|nr:(Fe-S)-binding protein [Desulfobacter sp.]